ncbi:HET-domain-containing protein, partial [Sporormia fimetaria CBS 119925]
MRLLYYREDYREDGELSITDKLATNAIPPYAILSHTWGAEDEEVTFDDLADNAGRDKPGYKKIQLCGEQAKRDGLQFFWVDTCCINKANKAELSQAIRSMFRWYRNAKKCYVYLEDVSIKKVKHVNTLSELTWKPAFSSSRWFTRGWTLQELLAPTGVEFFSRDWHKLGDRLSLKAHIHETTTIPYDVLEGASLSNSSIDERLRWAQNRETTLKEDAAYCLAGIFDVDMAPVYGEGIEQAFRRLHNKIQSRKDCLRDLRPTDPRIDKKRIQDTKGGLLGGSYRWVLDNSSFKQWHNDPQSQLLWLNSFPPGLDALYERMMQQIGASDDAELCKQVLASIALAYRPLSLAELVVLTERLEDLKDEAEVREIVGLCGSFLTLREDTVYFVHQSAQDFLLGKATDDVFPDGVEAAHRAAFSRSLETLSKTLHRDMYQLRAPGIHIDNVKPPTLDPLAASRYACVYWIDHLCDSKPKSGANESKDVQALDSVGAFIRKKYLYWLEGLSLCKSLAKGVVLMARLCSLVQEMHGGDELTKLLQDACRFIMYHKGAIESYPLQLYGSALLFSPTDSVIRKLFQHENPEGITIRPAMSSGWSACLQTLEGHS